MHSPAVNSIYIFLGIRKGYNFGFMYLKGVSFPKKYGHVQIKWKGEVLKPSGEAFPYDSLSTRPPAGLLVL